MNYETLVERLSEKTGISKEIFNLDNFDTSESKKRGLILLQQNKDHEYYFTARDYFENTNERWRSIALFVPIKVAGELVEIINQILSENEKDLINLEENPNEFKYSSDDEGLNVLLGQKQDDYYRIELARKN